MAVQDIINTILSLKLWAFGFLAVLLPLIIQSLFVAWMYTDELDKALKSKDYMGAARGSLFLAGTVVWSGLLAWAAWAVCVWGTK